MGDITKKEPEKSGSLFFGDEFENQNRFAQC
jgi:hypothetical protein